MTGCDNSQKKAKSLNLMERDLKIMMLTANSAIITSEEIWKIFDTSKGTHTHLRRIRQLCGAGYLSRVMGDGAVTLGYMLGRKGREYLSMRGHEMGKIRPLQRRYRGTFDHDRILHQIESILCKSPLVTDYFTDAELRSQMAKEYGASEARKRFMFVPDGTFSLKTAKGTYKVALELELSAKSKERYRKKFAHLLTTEAIDAVFFLIKDKAVERCVRSNAQYVKGNDPAVKWSPRVNAMYFADVTTFLKCRGDAPFFGADGSFSLRSLEDAQIKNEPKPP